MYTKDILIIAKSLKNNGTCIGGLDITNQNLDWREAGIDNIRKTSLKWVRPVKAIPKESFKQSDFNKLLPGVEFKLLDVITMTFIKPTPLNFQPENELVDLNTPWIKQNQYECAPNPDLDNLVHMDKNQLMDHSIRFYSPRHDRIPTTCFIEEPAKNSLQFIKLTHEENKTKLLYESRNSWKGIIWNPRLEFIYKGKFHNLGITDLKFPKLDHEPIKLEDGIIDVDIPEADITKLPCPVDLAYISIGFGAAFEPSPGSGLQHFKLIAGFISKLTHLDRWP